MLPPREKPVGGVRETARVAKFATALTANRRCVASEIDDRRLVACFRLCSAGVRDETQIHTHMCYSEFNDIIDAIAAMDADVISIETSRSKMELLDAFRTYKYPIEIGPGVYEPRTLPADITAI